MQETLCSNFTFHLHSCNLTEVTWKTENSLAWSELTSRLDLVQTTQKKARNLLAQSHFMRLIFYNLAIKTQPSQQREYTHASSYHTSIFLSIHSLSIGSSVKISQPNIFGSAMTLPWQWQHICSQLSLLVQKVTEKLLFT